MSLKFDVLIVVQFQRYCQQEAIENLDKSVLTFGSIKLSRPHFVHFVLCSQHCFELEWNGTFSCRPKLRQLEAAILEHF